MIHHLASTQQTTLRKQAVGSRRNDRSTRVPGGELHAVAPGDDLTRCGLSVARLHDFPEQDFADDLGDRCPECSIEAGLA